MHWIHLSPINNLQYLTWLQTGEFTLIGFYHVYEISRESNKKSIRRFSIVTNAMQNQGIKKNEI